jgi:hypothetical protein
VSLVRIGISPLAVDGAINGRIVPARWAQRAANAGGFHLTVDGDAGPLTLSAMIALNGRYNGGFPAPSLSAASPHRWIQISRRLELNLAALTYETSDTAPAITDPPPETPPPVGQGGADNQNVRQPVTDPVVTTEPATPDQPADQPAASTSILPWLALGALGLGVAAYLNRSGGGVSGFGFTKGDPYRDWGEGDPWRLVPIPLWSKLIKKGQPVANCEMAVRPGPLAAPNSIFHENILGKKRADGQWDVLMCRASVLHALADRARKGKR